MKTNKYFPVILFFLIAAAAAPCDLEDHFDFSVSNSEEVLYYGCYDAVNKGPHLIEYILTKARAEHTGVKRPDVPFTQNRDGGVLRGLLEENGHTLPSHNDYTRSGYDRGHMAPNGDFNDTTENATLTFFIANIWPQTPNLNRVRWLRAESYTRKLASEYGEVKVVIITDEFTDLKVGPVSVPLNFKRQVYNTETGELIYNIVEFQILTEN